MLDLQEESDYAAWAWAMGEDPVHLTKQAYGKLATVSAPPAAAAAAPAGTAMEVSPRLEAAAATRGKKKETYGLWYNPISLSLIIPFFAYRNKNLKP